MVNFLLVWPFSNFDLYAKRIYKYKREISMEIKKKYFD